MLFIDRQGWLHRLHPFSKLAYILLTGVLCYGSHSPLATSGLMMLLNSLLLFSGGVMVAAWRIASRILLPIMVFMVPIHGLLNPHNATPLFTFYSVSFYQEGLSFAAVTLLQLATVLLASLLLVITTRPADLIAAVSARAHSPTLAYLLGFPLLLLETMQGRIETIRSAQRARGLDVDGNVVRRFLGLGPLLFPLLISAIVEIEQRAIALEVRGFKSAGKKTSLRLVPDSLGQRIARWSMAGAGTIILVARFF